MAAEKLYYTDAFLKNFTATVTNCTDFAGKTALLLDRTAFYPEGGGQPADHGTIGDANVLDVQEKDGDIFHIVDRPVPPGTAVDCAVDWARRFDHMQQHSGEHILSGILCEMFACDNVGFHMGADTVTIDYNAAFTYEQALEAERRANAVIAADRAAEITFPSAEELERLDYRSKKALTGQVRIVRFPDADCCACCGTHVLRAGQVELVKILSCQKFREGVRLEILCGRRAVEFFDAVYDQSRAVAQALSVKPQTIADAVSRLQSELADAKFRAARMEEELCALTAREYAGAGDVLLLRPAMEPAAVRRLADAVAAACGGLAAVFAGEDGHYNYALLRADGADIAPLVKAMNAALNGRGGGRNGFAQGSAAASRAAIEEFFREGKK